MCKYFLLIFAIGCMSCGKRPTVVVLSEIRDYTSPSDPKPSGAKFYHLKNNSEYNASRLLLVEGGKSTELGSYALNADPSSDEYASIQFYTERSREEWWVWCLRSAANQIAVYQGPIEEGWRLYNGSRTRLKRLYSEVELIDTIIFTKTDTYLDEAECNRIIECETLADLEAATASIKDCRVAVITFEKDGDGVASAR